MVGKEEGRLNLITRGNAGDKKGRKKSWKKRKEGKRRKRKK